MKKISFIRTLALAGFILLLTSFVIYRSGLDPIKSFNYLTGNSPEMFDTLSLKIDTPPPYRVTIDSFYIPPDSLMTAEELRIMSSSKSGYIIDKNDIKPPGITDTTKKARPTLMSTSKSISILDKSDLEKHEQDKNIKFSKRSPGIDSLKKK